MSEPKRIVSDTGPLISLEKLAGGYDFIRQLYDEIIVPVAVLGEVAYGYDSPSSYVEERGITDFVQVEPAPPVSELPVIARLHEGEIQAIRLALERELPLLIEEKAGRRVARAVGLNISGVAGQIVKAFRQEILSDEEAKTMLSEMLEQRRINEKIYERLVGAIRKT